MSNIDTEKAKEAFIYAIRSNNVRQIELPLLDMFSVIDDHNNLWFNIVRKKDSEEYRIERFKPIINEYRLRKIPQNVEPNARLLMMEIRKQLALPAQLQKIKQIELLQR